MRYYLVDRHMTNKSTLKTAALLVYIVLIFGAQLFANIAITSSVCKGTPQTVPAIMYTVVPNILIFGTLVVLLNIYPGWRAPFSNTFGYFVVYLMGVNNALTSLLKLEGSRLINKICSDKSILINEITPLNFKPFLERMSSDGLLVKGYDTIPAYKTLWTYVGLKNNISDYLWYMLTGALVITTTYNALLDIKCSISVKDKQKAAAEFAAQQAAESNSQQQPHYYTVHD
jgi:hypothetical protein